MTKQQPSVCRNVIYMSLGSADGKYLPLPRAAIITEVMPWSAKNDDPDAVQNASLCVLNPEGLFFARNVPYSEKYSPGCWSWPTRV